jgi:hypothetical protein
MDFFVCGKNEFFVNAREFYCPNFKVKLMKKTAAAEFWGFFC